MKALHLALNDIGASISVVQDNTSHIFNSLCFERRMTPYFCQNHINRAFRPYLRILTRQHFRSNLRYNDHVAIAVNIVFIPFHLSIVSIKT